NVKKCLTVKELKKGTRLACQIKVNKNFIVQIPESSRTGKQRLQVEGIETPVDLNPIIKKYNIQLPKPTIENPRSDLDRILIKLQKEHNVSGLELKFNLLQRLGPFLRNSKWDITVITCNNQIIGFESGDTLNQLYGIAIDIGTTKLAIYLLNLITGELLAVESAMNPQISFGEDVISRINYASSLENTQELQQVLIKEINKMIDVLCEKSGISFSDIYEMVAVGNTAMHHIFLNINPKYLALAPYTPVVRNGINLESKAIGIKINSIGNLYCLPIIAGYNGADNIAVILATEIYKRDELCLALDIGTNTEVVLGNKEKMLVCSCASGPAFEGASIKYGMRAASGSIEKIRINSETFECKYQTIDNMKPRGICGSAIVDIIAEMVKTGIIDLTGKMNNEIKSNKFQKSNDGYEFILVNAKDTSIGKDIVITQKDVRQLTLAKAAIHTGCVILMEELGINEADIDKVFIAGAFGNYIDIKNARIIGMYPEIDLSKVETVGNAAGTGARMALLSKNIRNIAETISKQIKYIELAAKKNFQSIYLNSTFLPYADLSKYPETSDILKKLGLYPRKPLHMF
ncbi:MAG: ASKHA domain-containing protein, partial [Promethearchaeota archaeon]